MTKQFVARIATLAAVVAASSLMPPPAIAQRWVTESACPDNSPAVFHRCAMEAAEAFDPPRTPDGRPDMGGIWRLPDGNIGGVFEDLEEHPRTVEDIGGPTAIVDPPDGKVPMRAWADARRKEIPERYIHHFAACFLSGVPETMYHGEAREFLQTPDNLVIMTVSVNSQAYRIIRLDGRPHVGENIRLWNGDSNGHWEGDTLVIETTNQNGRPWIDQRGRFYTEEALVVERLTLIDADTIHYQATIDDPNVYTRPFTMAVAYRRSTEETNMSVACYENNEVLMELYRGLGMEIYPGISASEAREAMEAE